MINGLKQFSGVESVVRAGSGAESEFETETRKQIKKHVKKLQADTQSPFKDLDEMTNAINNLGARVEDLEEIVDPKMVDDKVTTQDVPSKAVVSLDPATATLAEVAEKVNELIKRLN